jgi:hypothetical protein
MSIIPGFGGSMPSPPPLPPPPPPAPERTDPEVLKAKQDLKASVARRRGRTSSILTQNSQGGGSVLNASATGDDETKLLG